MAALVGTSDIDQVRDATDLVGIIAEHVPLRPRGREHVGMCPFHDDHKPSLTVVTHKGNAFYKCHSCGAAGNVFTFVMDYHKMTFPEALRYLADRAGIRLSRTSQPPGPAGGPSHADLRQANAVATAFYRNVLGRDRRGSGARAVVARRGISDEIAAAFMIGAAPAEWDALSRHAAGRGIPAGTLAAAGLVKPRSEGQGHYDTFRNRLIFPICDELGRPVAFGGRKLEPDEGPKYLNSPESPLFVKSRMLYGLHLAKRAVMDARRIIVTEGYTDVIACHQAGLVNVVATLGTALTRDHVRVLKRLCDEVLLVFDGDEAGQRAADRAVELFFCETVDVKICILPEGQDPADLLARPDGRQRLSAMLAEATDALEFKVRRFRSRLSEAGGLSARQRALEHLLADLSALGFDAMPGVRKSPVMTQLADLMDVRIEDIEAALPRRRGGAPVPQPRTEAAASSLWEETDPRTTPARRRAERELLASLIHQPSLRHQPVGGHEGSDATIVHRVRPEQFSDPAARRVAEVLWRRLDADEGFSVQQLMDELDDPGLRKLVGDLYVDAQRYHADEGESAVETLRARVAAFERLMERQRFRRDVDALRRTAASPDSGDVLRRVIDQRRQQGYIPEAIPTRVRS